jgi:hypothetical protein
MMKLFPEPTANMPNPPSMTTGLSPAPAAIPTTSSTSKIDHRFNQKNLMSAKYSQQWNSSSPFNCFGNFADPCAGGPNQTAAHLFTINDEHTFSKTLLADRDARLHPRR